MKTSILVQKGGLTLVVLGLSMVISAPAQTIKVSPGESIQAAVNAAASGNTIHIAAGVYQEQILIADKNLNLVGEPGATIQAPDAMITTLAPVSTRRAVLGVVRSTVNVGGLAFDGNRTGAANAGLTGIYHLAASGMVNNCSFQGFRSDPRNQLALGQRETAYIGANIVAAAGSNVTHVEVLNSAFTDNETGIIVQGDETTSDARQQLRQTFVVEGNRIIGLGGGTHSYQTGVRINCGASGQIRNNTIRNHLSSGNITGLGLLGSTGIMVRDDPTLRPNNPLTTQPVLVEGNTLVNNLVGIDLFVADGSRAFNNQIQGAGTETGFANEGGVGLSGNDVGAISNRISHSSVGINLLASSQHGTASNATVIANAIFGSATPINEQTGVTGTKQSENLFLEEFSFKPSGITQLPNGTIRVTAQITSSRSYRLEVSNDLKIWATVVYFGSDADSGPDAASEFVWIDADAANHPCRFYRMRWD